jgi:hypothetical protein
MAKAHTQIAIRMMNIEQGVANHEVGSLYFYIQYSAVRFSTSWQAG